MSDYEFWDELGNIFNAVVAYQQKTIEFNKRFVNPWIRLGAVFDQNDHNAEALTAHRRAIEIDQENPNNWLSLGDVHFKMGALDDAGIAYRKAIELNPKLGWAYANLALICATRQQYTEAVNLYVKSLELLTDDKDRSMIWNRLGNTYRKVNDYENAFIAFQMADECDGQNTGFEDALDEVTVEQRVMPIVAEVYVNQNAVQIQRAAAEAAVDTEQEETDVASPAEEPVNKSQSEEAAGQTDASVESQAVAEPIAEAEPSPDVEAPIVEEPVSETQAGLAVESADAAGESQVVTEAILVTEQDQGGEAPVAEAIAPEAESAALTESESVPAEAVVDVSTEAALTEAEADLQAFTASCENETQVTDEATIVEGQPEAAVEESTGEMSIVEIMPAVEEPTAETQGEETIAEEPLTAQADAPVMEISADTTITPALSHDVETFADPSALNAPVVLAVEDIAELLVSASGEEDAAVEENAIETVEESEVQYEMVDAAELDENPGVQTEAVEVAVVDEVAATNEASPVATSEAEVAEADAQAEPVAEVETGRTAESIAEPAYDEYLKETPEPVLVTEPAAEPVRAELQVEPDTRNAHVWNELGNVYFNTGSFEEAVTAYSKAIELDDRFAWPYSNLALVYVQKEKYAEAILLYQRSIDLFASDKDKAITWNRLGNVYRRLTEYGNAITCYQRADELDPNNATRSLRSRFSLLGNLSMDQTASLAV
jgi:tetratricopeptide (TPR) repeat protein